MIMSKHKSSGLRQLEELPGVSDVVWAIVASLDDVPTSQRPARLVFVSPETGAGTTLLAAATALGLARHQRVPVCLVETNVERPALASYLGLRTAGLTDILDGRAEAEECIQNVPGFPGLHVLTGGTPREPVAGEFTAAPFASILERLDQLGHYVILDAPPALDHFESRRLLQHADGAILVLRAGSTRRDAAECVQRILFEARVPLLGSIFNAYRSRPPLLNGAVVDRLRALAESAWHPSLDESETEPAGGDTLRSESGSASLPPTGSAHSDDAREQGYRRQIDLLERRIAKLTLLLEQTEDSLRHLAQQKNVDPGIPSIYRGVQGLSSEEEALALKQSLMKEIFRANLDLKDALARQQRVSPAAPNAAAR
jgi:Mrp family chromosome partitioning ATPase